MQKKYLALVSLIALLHLVPSCDWFMRCDDPVAIYVKTDSVEVTPLSVPPHDRNTLDILIKLWPNDSLLYWVQKDLPTQSLFISSAVAFQCEDDYVVLEEHIKRIEILNLFDQSGFVEGADITSGFVTGAWGTGLYQELEEKLSQNPQQLTLVYKEVPTGDSIGFVVNTTLSDNRIFIDTLILQLQ